MCVLNKSNDGICSPMDYSSAGQILDDEMNSIMVHSLPEGCHLTCIYDSAYIYRIDARLGMC